MIKVCPGRLFLKTFLRKPDRSERSAARIENDVIDSNQFRLSWIAL
jgi:hypothetical protein